MANYIKNLIKQFPVNGELIWIGVRPAQKQEMVAVKEIQADCQQGLKGDHYSGRNGKRHVTLIQWEHLAVLESFTGRSITPDLLRRNLVIRGINLMALKNQTFQIGNAVFKMTGLCHPCSRMEIVLGQGGYNAMRNHGGINAQITESGLIKTGDTLSVLEQDKA
jgi:MOSC domain-containing protein YiiM